MQVFDHSGDTCFIVVVFYKHTELPVVGPSLFCFVRLCVEVPYGSGIF